MANIQVFEYQNNKVRTVDVDGEAWFVLKDVCAVLGISNNRMAADRLDDDEKGVSLIDALGGKQEMVIVNESGLYHVILRSDKPEAAPFRRWVTNDVLPAIRKTGSYNAPQLTRSQLLATALIAAHEELEEKDKQIAELTPDAEFARAVCIADNCRTATSIAKDYGLTAEKAEQAALQPASPVQRQRRSVGTVQTLSGQGLHQESKRQSHSALQRKDLYPEHDGLDGRG